MTNPIDTAAFRRAHEATTPGSWEAEADGNVWCGASSKLDNLVAPTFTQGDAHFIALAHREWPALLDRIEALEAENARLRSDLTNNTEAMTGCEGCGAPLYPSDEFCLGEDCSGCWAMMTGNHKSTKGTLCFAYRVGKPDPRTALGDPT